MNKARPTQLKRERERAKKERQQKKVARREESKARRAAGPARQPGEVDPDIAHIVPGPQPPPDED
jgi:hypothetical protein